MNIELSLLSTMLHTGDFGPIIRGEITKEHFGTDEGQVLFTFITTYRKETDGQVKYPSLKIVRRRFSHVELPDPDPGDTVEALAHETIQQKYRADLRAFAAECEQIANGAEAPVEKAIPLLTRFRKSTETNLRTDSVSLATGLYDFVNRYGTGQVIEAGLPYPWPSLNTATRGMRKGEFIVVSGRPKSRKTFTALRIATHAVKHHHTRVLVFSPEMAPQSVFLRCIAHFCDLPYSELKDGTLAEAEEMRLFEAAEAFGRLKDMSDESYLFHLQQKIPGLGAATPSLEIVKSAGRDTGWMASQIEMHKPDLVICDSFYKQRATGARKYDVDYKAVTLLSRELKDLAMETNTIILGTHQLNRDAQHSVGDINNLAWADAIGQDADAVYRVLTGQIEGQEASALIVLAAREFNFEGLLFRNNPCYDYSEIGTISNKRQVLDLMKQEEKAAEREENERLRAAASTGGRRLATAEERESRGTGQTKSALVKHARGKVGKGFKVGSPFVKKAPPEDEEQSA